MNNLNNCFSIFREDNAASFLSHFSAPNGDTAPKFCMFKEKKKKTYLDN